MKIRFIEDNGMLRPVLELEEGHESLLDGSISQLFSTFPQRKIMRSGVH